MHLSSNPLSWLVFLDTWMILALKGNGKQGTLLIPECMLSWFNFILGSNFIYSSNLLSYNILPYPKAKKNKI